MSFIIFENHKAIDLIKSGHNPNEYSKSGKTIFMKLIEDFTYGNAIFEDIIHAINLGANVNQKNNKGRHSLFYTTNIEVARLLIRTGCEVNLRDNSGDSVLKLRYRNPFHKEFCQYLIHAGGNTSFIKSSDIEYRKFNDFFYNGTFEREFNESIKNNQFLDWVKIIEEKYPLNVSTFQSLLCRYLLNEETFPLFIKFSIQCGHQIGIDVFIYLALNNYLTGEIKELSLVIPDSSIGFRARQSIDEIIDLVQTRICTNFPTHIEMIKYYTSRFEAQQGWLKIGHILEMKSLLNHTRPLMEYYETNFEREKRFAKGVQNVSNNFFIPKIKPAVSSFLYYIFKDYYIDAEKEWRIKNRLPLNESGWKTETELYYSLRDYFLDIEITQHKQLKWLGLQHLDIYFEGFDLAIEYQGEQHQRPISFFGGEEAFKKTVERDQRKRALCKENNCKLIYVYPNFDLDEVIAEIKYHLNLKK